MERRDGLAALRSLFTEKYNGAIIDVSVWKGTIDMKKINLLAAVVLALVLVVVFQSQSAGSDEEIFVMAAASLQDVMSEVAEVYTEQTGTDVVLNFASSGTLRKGIEEGADPHIFLSASTKQMDLLAERGFVDAEYRKILVMNQVVLIASQADSGVMTLGDIAGSEAMLAIGDPDFVPAGRYALQVLLARGLDQPLEEHFLLCKDVNQVLAYVDGGESEFGMLYRTDAMTSGNVHIVEAYGPEESGVVEYPAALLETGRGSESARDFFAFLFGEEARGIFEAHGFLIMEDYR